MTESQRTVQTQFKGRGFLGEYIGSVKKIFTNFYENENKRDFIFRRQIKLLAAIP